MRIAKINSVEIIDESGDIVEIRPEIPFDQFPPGLREAKPDESGRLAWYITLA